MMSLTNQQPPVRSIADRRRSHRQLRAKSEPATKITTGLGDREALLRFLNEALATELVCALRYRRHHFMARALESQRIAEEFLVHSDEELAHADLLAGRIVQLGGEPDFAPETLRERSHSAYAPAATISEMVAENLKAERLSIDHYRGLIEFVGEDDPATRRVLEGILGVEEAHADELAELAQGEKQPG